MVLWRISNHGDLSGLGGERCSGRWHTARLGKRIVYLAEHPAVALLETLVHLRGDPSLFPERFQLLRIVGPDAAAAELTETQNATLNHENLGSTQLLGDAWLAAGSSALLRVPSFPSPESWNYLLNPLHPQADTLAVEWKRYVVYDKRLFRLNHA